MPRPKESEREQILQETRQALLQAAAAAFARDGYVGANINQISKAAGFAKGTIYNHFPSKRALMQALIDDVAARHVTTISQAVRSKTDPRQRLERFFAAGFAFVADHPAQSRAVITTLYGPDQAFREHLFRAYKPLFALVGREIVAAGIEKGQFRVVDPEATATLVMTIYLGTSSQVDPAGRPWLPPKAVADFVGHALTD